ncbi:hypothetical protein ACRCRN_32280 [Pseudomonas aeruginosa]|jgi:enoyl-CoA hydratase/carnithine racemase
MSKQASVVIATGSGKSFVTGAAIAAFKAQACDKTSQTKPKLPRR